LRVPPSGPTSLKFFESLLNSSHFGPFDCIIIFPGGCHHVLSPFFSLSPVESLHPTVFSPSLLCSFPFLWESLFLFLHVGAGCFVHWAFLPDLWALKCRNVFRFFQCATPSPNLEPGCFEFPFFPSPGCSIPMSIPHRFPILSRVWFPPTTLFSRLFPPPPSTQEATFFSTFVNGLSFVLAPPGQLFCTFFRTFRLF